MFGVAVAGEVSVVALAEEDEGDRGEAVMPRRAKISWADLMAIDSTANAAASTKAEARANRLRDWLSQASCVYRGTAGSFPHVILYWHEGVQGRDLRFNGGHRRLG